MKTNALFILLGFFVGAIAHENDIANNCDEKGNARAWFHNIVCTVNYKE